MSHRCKECCRIESGRYTDNIQQEMEQRQLCFDCNFWMNYVMMAMHLQVVRIKGVHYCIGEDRVHPASMRGFGGTKFMIKFFDRRVVTTNNLWSQGHIPRHFRERLPDNAEFLKER